MGKCYCDYCDVFLTHDSASVRKQHNDGNRHRQNVCEYYRQYIVRSTQERIDKIVYEFERRVADGLVLPTYGVSNINGRPAEAETREQASSAQGKKTREEGEEDRAVGGKDVIIDEDKEGTRNNPNTDAIAGPSSDDTHLALLDSPSQNVSDKPLSKLDVSLDVEQGADMNAALVSHTDATTSPPTRDDVASVAAEPVQSKVETMLEGQTEGPTVDSEPAVADDGSDMDLDDD
jgi:U1 zinc finger